MVSPSQPDFSSRVSEWSVVLVLTGCLISTIASPQFIAPLVMLFALAVTVAGFRTPRIATVFSAPVLAAVLLLGWAVASILWSVDPGLSMKRSFRLFLMIAMGTMVAVYLPRLTLSQQAQKSVVFTTWLVLAAIVADTVAGSPLGRALMAGGDPLDRAASVMVVLVWPIGVLAHRQFGLIGLAVLVGGTVLAVGLLDNKAAMLAAVVGFFAALCAHVKPRVIAVLPLVSVLVFAVAVPVSIGGFKSSIQSLVADTSVDASIRHRLHVWNFSAEKASEKPVMGWGMGSSRAVPGGDEVRVFPGFDGRFSGQGESLPLHPHNGFLQVFLELGIVGLLLAAGTIFLVLKNLAAKAEESGLTAPVAGFILSVMIVGSISFGAWQGWWVSLQLLAGALLFAFCREKSG